MLFLKYRICPSNPFLAEKTYVRPAPVIFPGGLYGLMLFLKYRISPSIPLLGGKNLRPPCSRNFSRGVYGLMLFLKYRISPSIPFLGGKNLRPPCSRNFSRGVYGLMLFFIYWNAWIFTTIYRLYRFRWFLSIQFSDAPCQNTACQTKRTGKKHPLFTRSFQFQYGNPTVIVCQLSLLSCEAARYSTLTDS